MTDRLAPKPADSTIERGIHLGALQHGMLFCLFVIYGSFIFGLLFWYLTRVVLPPSVSLVMKPQWVSPTIVGGVSIHYVGFGIPLVVAVASTLCCWKLVPSGAHRISIFAKFLLIMIPPSIYMSQVTFGGSLVPVGYADPVILCVLTGYLYILAIRPSSTEAVLLAYPVGFLIGFLSDLESLLHVSGGVFGGYGFADGDFTVPLVFLIATLLFAKTWRRTSEVIQKVEAVVTRRLERFIDE